MKRASVKSLLGLGLAATAIGLPSARAEDDFVIERRAVLFVLDISGSMQGAYLNQVRSTLKQVVATSPKRTAFGLVSFSGCAPTDIRLEVPLEKGAGPQVVQKAEALTTGNGTDIYGGLEMAEAEVKRFGPDWCTKVILLSDGGDTCGRGDPTKIAKRIVSDDQACNVVSAITVGLPAWETGVFDEIAKAGKGKSVNIEELEKIDQALDEELKQHLEKPRTKTGPGWEGDYTGNKPKEGDAPKKDAPDDKPPAPADEKDPLKAKEKKKKENE